MKEQIHVVPINDTKEHDESMACHCRPEIQPQEGNYVIVHNAFDGREWKELSNNPPHRV